MSKKAQSTEVGLFSFKEIDTDEYLLTNIYGNYLFVDKQEFIALRDRKSEISPQTLDKLRAGGFLVNEKNRDSVADKFAEKNAFLNQGPSLHIVVLTLRCDHQCVYCQVSRKNAKHSGCDMTRETAEKTVDFLLNTTSQSLCIEFQGGEPLLNFDVLEHLVNYTKTKAHNKDVIFSVVTNLRHLDDNKLKFLMDNEIAICTSLDGPEEVHNRSRVLKQDNSFQITVDGIKKIQALNIDKDLHNQKFNRINALLTVTRNVLTKHKEMVDLYVDLGLKTIHLRPLNPFGYARKLNDSIAYSAEEFLEFYEKSLDYIVALNKSGVHIVEKNAQIFLNKIINKRDSNYLDLRSPCGAGIGQIAYNYDGAVFPCDEARMVHAAGDSSFHLGDVVSSSYEEVIQHDVVKSLCVASCLEGLPGCHDCVYRPYCGVCPVYNYVEHGSIFGSMPTNERCTIHMGMQDILFKRIRKNADVFESWVKIV